MVNLQPDPMIPPRVAAGETQRTVARIYNVSQSTISRLTHSQFAEC